MDDRKLGFSGEDDGDLAAGVLAQLEKSVRSDHQHICAAVGSMAQTLKDKGFPRTPVAYFGATVSSLDIFSSNPSSATDPAVPALLSFLTTVLPRVPRPAVRSRWAEAAETLIRVLRFESLPLGGLKAGLKCASYLLAVADKTNWSNLLPLYKVIIGCIGHKQPKIRKACSSSLSDALLSFQGSAVLAMACEEIKEIFERSMLLAGGSSTSTSPAEGSKGALQILYILNMLKHCLPLMTMNYTSTLLQYCKILLELRQSIVTSNIMDVLHALCINPTLEVAPELLLDLLCSIAVSVDDKEKSADAMASKVRLLHVGIKKVYNLNKQLCTLKLPIIFNALGEILASEHEEAIFSAMEALNSLISYCVNEAVIKQGVDQIKATDGGIRRSGPTIIEKICATMEGFLGYRYNAVWDMSFQVLSTAFRQLGISSFYLMAGAVRGLADIQKLPDEDFPHRKQLHECLGSSLAAMGPEKFLSILPLDLDSENISETNAWLIPILKQYIVGARLSFFSENVLVMARCIQQKSQQLEKEARIFSARSAEGLVYSLWSLFPSFCNYPTDTPTGFRVLRKELCNVLRQEPSFRGVICSGLQTLIQQNRHEFSEHSTMPDDEWSLGEKKETNHYTRKESEENLEAIKSFSSDFLSVLSEIFLTSSKDGGGCLQSTIHEFASISDKKVVKKFFSGTMRKLLEVTEKVNNLKQPSTSHEMQIDDVPDEPTLSHLRALLLDLTASLLPGLDDKEINALYNAIKPVFKIEEGIIQKKAYKILSVVLKERSKFLSSNLDELLTLMIESLPSCQFAAKRYRLECLYFLIVHVSKDLSVQWRDIISSFLTEIILALKEANKKTRNRAYDLLVEIGHACEDKEQGGANEKLQQLFNMVAGGLAGETPHMISAAIKGLARLAYEFPDLIGSAYNLLPLAFLIQMKNREIIKANLGLVKVLVAKSKADILQMHLSGMVEGLLKWQDDTKNHLKAKVKTLLEMLVRKCGVDAVKAVMPEEHMKLLNNIRKTKERKDRKAKSEEDAESLGSRTTISRQSRWNHSRIFSDFGDEADNDSDEGIGTGRTFASHSAKLFSHAGSRASVRSHWKCHAAKSLSEESFDQQWDEDPLDFLDMQKTRSALHTIAHRKRKQATFDGPEIDADGRIVVHDENYRPKEERKSQDSDIRSQRSHRDSRSIPSSSTKMLKKRRKTSESGWAYTGNEYTTKRAGGDIKKKDKLEPYAYWPLDRKLLNRRAERKAVARKGMSRVMNFTKSLEGKSASCALYVKGQSMKKNQRKNNKIR